MLLHNVDALPINSITVCLTMLVQANNILVDLTYCYNPEGFNRLWLKKNLDCFINSCGISLYFRQLMCMSTVFLHTGYGYMRFYPEIENLI